MGIIANVLLHILMIAAVFHFGHYCGYVKAESDPYLNKERPDDRHQD